MWAFVKAGPAVPLINCVTPCLGLSIYLYKIEMLELP